MTNYPPGFHPDSLEAREALCPQCCKREAVFEVWIRSNGASIKMRFCSKACEDSYQMGCE